MEVTASSRRVHLVAAGATPVCGTSPRRSTDTVRRGAPVRGYHRAVSSPDERRGALELAAAEARSCVRCPQLAATRTQVVFGRGPVGAPLVLVGEAPGRQEDLQGAPLLGRARRTLDELLREVGIDPAGVYRTTALLCRPPDNRDPTPAELDRCRTHLLAQLDHVGPRVVCPLGSVATRLLRGAPDPILRVRGRPEVVEILGRHLRLLPLVDPAAALYRRETLEQLRADVALLPALLELAPPGPVAAPGAPAPPLPPAPVPDERPGDGQLGLF